MSGASRFTVTTDLTGVFIDPPGVSETACAAEDQLRDKMLARPGMKVRSCAIRLFGALDAS